MSLIAPIGAGGGLPGLGATGGLAAPAASPAPASTIGSAGAQGQAAPASGSGSFTDALGQAFGQLNEQIGAADAAAASFASGGSVDLGSAMLSMSEASIGLRAGIGVRDRLLEAYQEIMRLQV